MLKIFLRNVKNSLNDYLKNIKILINKKQDKKKGSMNKIINIKEYEINELLLIKSILSYVHSKMFHLILKYQKIVLRLNYGFYSINYNFFIKCKKEDKIQMYIKFNVKTHKDLIKLKTRYIKKIELLLKPLLKTKDNFNIIFDFYKTVKILKINIDFQSLIYLVKKPLISVNKLNLNNQMKKIEKNNIIYFIENIKADNIFNYYYKNIFFKKQFYFLFNTNFINFFEQELFKANFFNKQINDNILYNYFYNKKEKTLNKNLYLFYLTNNNINKKQNNIKYFFSHFSGSFLFSELLFYINNINKISLTLEKKEPDMFFYIFPISLFDIYHFSYKKNKSLEYYLNTLSEDLVFYEKKIKNLDNFLDGIDYDYSLLLDENLVLPINYKIIDKYNLDVKNIIDIESLSGLYNIYLDIYFHVIFPQYFDVYFLNEIFYPKTVNVLIFPVFYEILKINYQILDVVNNINFSLTNFLYYNYDKLNINLWLIYTELVLENIYYKKLVIKHYEKKTDNFFDILDNIYSKYKNDLVIYDLRLEFYIMYNDLLRQVYLIDQDKIAYLSIEKNKFINYKEVINYKFERYYNSIILSEELYNKYYNNKDYYISNGFEDEYYYYDFEDIFEEYDIFFLDAINDLGEMPDDVNGKIDEDNNDVLSWELTELISNDLYLELVNNVLFFKNNKILEKLKLDKINQLNKKIGFNLLESVDSGMKFKYKNVYKYLLGSDDDMFDYDSDYYSSYDLKKETYFETFSFKMKNYMNFNITSFKFYYMDYLIIFIFYYYYLYIIKVFILDYILNMEYNKKVSQKYLFGPFYFFKNRLSYKYNEYFNYSYEFFGTFKKLKNYFSNKKIFVLKKNNLVFLVKQNFLNLQEKAFDFNYFSQLNITFFTKTFNYGLFLQLFIFFPMYIYKSSFELINVFALFFYNYSDTKEHVVYGSKFYAERRYLQGAFLYEFLMRDPIMINLASDVSYPLDGEFSDYDNFVGDEITISSMPLESLGLNGYLAEIDERFNYDYEYITPVLPLNGYGNLVDFLLRLNFIKDCIFLFFLRFCNFFYFDFIRLMVKGFIKSFFLIVNSYSFFIYIFCLFFFFCKQICLFVFFFIYKKIISLYKSVSFFFFNNSFLNLLFLFFYYFNLLIALVVDFVYFKIITLSLNLYKNLLFLKYLKSLNFIYVSFRFIFKSINIILLFVLKLILIYFLLIYLFDHYDSLVYYFSSFFAFKIPTQTYFFMHSVLVFLCLIVFFYPLKISLFLWVQRYWILVVILILWAFASLKNNEFFYLVPLFDKLYIEGQHILYGEPFLKGYLKNWYLNDKALFFDPRDSLSSTNLYSMWKGGAVYDNLVSFVKKEMHQTQKYVKKFLKKHKEITKFNLNVLNPFKDIYIYLKTLSYYNSLYFVKTFFVSYFDFIALKNNLFIEKFSIYFYNIYLQTLYVDSIFFSGLYDVYMYGFNNNYILDKDKLWMDFLSGSLFFTVGLRYLPLYTTKIYKNTAISYTYIDELFLKNYVEKSEKYYRYNSVFVNSILAKNLKKYKRHMDYDLLNVKSKYQYLDLFFKYKDISMFDNIEELDKENPHPITYESYPVHFGIQNQQHFDKDPSYVFFNSRSWPIYSEYFYTSLYNNQLKYAIDYSKFLYEKDFPEIENYIRNLDQNYGSYFFYVISPIKRLYRYNTIKSQYYFSQNNLLQLRNILSYDSNIDYLKYYLYIMQSKLIDSADLTLNFSSPLSTFKFNKRLLLRGYLKKYLNFINNEDFIYYFNNLDVINKIQEDLFELMDYDYEYNDAHYDTFVDQEYQSDVFVKFLEFDEENEIKENNLENIFLDFYENLDEYLFEQYTLNLVKKNKDQYKLNFVTIFKDYIKNYELFFYNEKKKLKDLQDKEIQQQKIPNYLFPFSFFQVQDIVEPKLKVNKKKISKVFWTFKINNKAFLNSFYLKNKAIFSLYDNNNYKYSDLLNKQELIWFNQLDVLDPEQLLSIDLDDLNYHRYVEEGTLLKNIINETNYKNSLKTKEQLEKEEEEMHDLNAVFEEILLQKKFNLHNEDVYSDLYYMWYFIMPVFLKKYEERLFLKSKYTNLLNELQIKATKDIKNFYFPKTTLSSFLLNYDLPFAENYSGARIQKPFFYTKFKLYSYKRHKVPYYFRNKFLRKKLIKKKKLKKFYKLFKYFSYQNSDSIHMLDFFFKTPVNFSYLKKQRHLLYRKHKIIAFLDTFDPIETKMVNETMWDTFNEWAVLLKRESYNINPTMSPEQSTNLATALGFFNETKQLLFIDELLYKWRINYSVSHDDFNRILFNDYNFNKLVVRDRQVDALNEPRGTYHLKAFNKLLNDTYLDMSILNYISLNMKYSAIHEFNPKYFVYSYNEVLNTENSVWIKKMNKVYPDYIKYLYELNFSESVLFRIVRSRSNIYSKYLEYNKYLFYNYKYKINRLDSLFTDFVNNNELQNSNDFLDNKSVVTSVPNDEVVSIDKIKFIDLFVKKRINFIDYKLYNNFIKSFNKIFYLSLLDQKQNNIKLKYDKILDLLLNLKKYKLKKDFYKKSNLNDYKYYIEGEKTSKKLYTDYKLILKNNLENALIPFDLYNIKKKRSYNKYYKGAFIDVWATSTWVTNQVTKPFLKRYYFDNEKIFSKNKFYRFKNLQSYYALVGEPINYHNDVDYKYFDKKKDQLNYHTMNKNRVYFTYLNSILYSFRETLWGKVEPNLDHFFYFYRGNRDLLKYSSTDNVKFIKRIIDKPGRKFPSLLRKNLSFDSVSIKKASLYKNKYKKLKMYELNKLIVDEFNLKLNPEDNILLQDLTFDKNLLVKKEELQLKKKINKINYLSSIRRLKFQNVDDYNLKRKIFRKRKIEQNMRRQFKMSRMGYLSYQNNEFFEQATKRYMKKKEMLKSSLKNKYVNRRNIKYKKRKNRFDLFYDRHRTRFYWYKFLVPDIGYYGSSFWGRDFQFMNLDYSSARKTNFYSILYEKAIKKYNT